jgi:ABC-2 type transport system permease protein/sodium transport system permease protein
MTITGAVYPAIDLTAGERERGTLEILMAAPVPRVSILLAKYVTVLTVALLTALINLGMMTATFLVLGIGPGLLSTGPRVFLVLVEVLGLLILLAAFFSAVLLTLTSLARSFKEAQAYLIPLMLVAITPGMLSLLPDLRLEGVYLWVPLLNIVLLARDLLDGVASPAAAGLVVLITLGYAVIALVLAARIFGQSAVPSGDEGWLIRLFHRLQGKSKET